ncbi:MAG: dihydropteroate synthase, partial [Chloroflexota bacterium]
MRRSTAETLLLPSGALELDRVRIMGILNITPDSFYDQGRFRHWDDARARAETMAAEGAGIIDIGGEKAGPGEPVSIDEEIERVTPIIEWVRRQLPVIVSVDTFKAPVARAAIGAGADIINSIGGFDDPAMRQVAATNGAAVVVMHIQG